MKITIAALTLSLFAARSFAQPPEAPPLAPPPVKAPPSIVPPVTDAPPPEKRGDLLSLDFKDIPVREIIEIIAQTGKLKVEVEPGAKRRGERVIERIALKDVTPQDALREVARVSGLTLAADGAGFKMDKDPAVRSPATRGRASRELWAGGEWKKLAKPFVLTLRLAGQEGEPDEVAQEIQVGEGEAFAFTLLAAGIRYGVQGKAGSVVQGEDGGRRLPVKLRITRRGAGAHGSGTSLSTQVRVPLDDDAMMALGGMRGGFAPTISAQDNADYTAAK